MRMMLLIEVGGLLCMCVVGVDVAIAEAVGVFEAVDVPFVVDVSFERLDVCFLGGGMAAGASS